jgi:hypothetical protein
MRMKTEEPTIENSETDFIRVAQVEEIPAGKGRVFKVLGGLWPKGESKVTWCPVPGTISNLTFETVSELMEGDIASLAMRSVLMETRFVSVFDDEESKTRSKSKV